MHDLYFWLHYINSFNMPKYDCKSRIIELSPGYILARSVHIHQDSNHLFSRAIYITEILTSDCKK